ncbi:sugar ABC transporter permease, partial [Cutibacterium acnes]
MASRKARHEALTGWLFALPFTIVFIIVFVAPIIESIRAGFHKQVAEGGG